MRELRKKGDAPRIDFPANGMLRCIRTAAMVRRSAALQRPIVWQDWAVRHTNLREVVSESRCCQLGNVALFFLPINSWIK